jgi:hypothetical protein
MVWCPPNFDQFVLVDDSGALLNKGKPTGELPYLGERQKNYMVSYMHTSMASYCEVVVNFVLVHSLNGRVSLRLGCAMCRHHRSVLVHSQSVIRHPDLYCM